MIYLLTPTGRRSEGFALLAGYINAQTYTGPLIWIVVDDCDPATPIPAMREGIEVQVIRPGWRWMPGQNTQAACMDAGLGHVPDDARLLVMEDDDLYLPEHVETMAAALGRAELVGEFGARYYNVATRRHRTIPSDRHASLAATGCRGDALALLRDICARGSRRIDMELWHGYTGAKAALPMANVVGIKGLPGRAGIGVGHRPDFGQPDPSGNTLRAWVGERARAYL